MTQPDPDSPSGTAPALSRYAMGLSLGVIWLSTLAAALLSPDMITGSQHEHLPLAAALGWVWAAVATGYVLLARAGRDRESGPGGFVVSIVIVWAVMAIASIFAPSLITGTDPTQIPLVAIVAPLAAMAATGFICLYATTTRKR